MRKRFTVLGPLVFAATLAGLGLRATTIGAVGTQPLIYRVTSLVNDLDSVEGLAPPGAFVELWVKQRNFVQGEGGSTTDPFSWCAWKNNGNPILLATTQADAGGIWRLASLRSLGTTVMLFPAAPGADACRGGVYTELLPRACDAPGVNCSAWSAPQLNWLDVRKPSTDTGALAGSVSGAEQTAAAVADGPNDGSEPSDVVDVDQNGIDTTTAGFTPGQKVTWRCGSGGTAVCPAIAVHDGSTAITTDPEFPYLLGTIQAHRAGGSFIAAGAISRPAIGFAVNVDVRLRGRFDVNLGCDNRQFFDFSVPLG
jgi:hypothetical protein